MAAVVQPEAETRAELQPCTGYRRRGCLWDSSQLPSAEEGTVVEWLFLGEKLEVPL